MADTLFDEKNTPAQDYVEPSFVQVIKSAFQAFSGELRVGGPATVINYDEKKQLATVQPDFKRKYPDGTVQDAPLIYNVPVGHPRAGSAFVHVPVKAGHKVYVHYSDKSLEKWLTSGAPADPEDTRTHHLSDAVAYPGVYSFADPAKVANNEDIIVKNDNLEMRIKPNGKLQVLNQNEELIKVLNDMIDRLISGWHGGLYDIQDRLRTFLS